jgi:hypothetical protein
MRKGKKKIVWDEKKECPVLIAISQCKKVQGRPLFANTRKYAGRYVVTVE